MSHHISGLVGLPSILATFAKTYNLPGPAVLNGQLSFLPICPDTIDQLFQDSGGYEGLVYLSDSLKQAMQELSIVSPIAYIETDYFGGTGAQGAIVFQDGHCVYEPINSEIGPISTALRLLGVRKKANMKDEFDEVGLGRFRSNDGWIDCINCAMNQSTQAEPLLELNQNKKGFR